MVAHKQRAHAKLSASGSSRWLACPGSVQAEKDYPNTSSVYAEEGTTAHELADICLGSGDDTCKHVGCQINNQDITLDMARHVQEYLDYVRSYETSDSELFTEEKVNFSFWVPDGFGTMDAAVLDVRSKVCHIFDLKYGKGVVVSATNNTQAQMYALGFLNDYGFLYEIEKFVIHIVQPRVSNFDSWTISTEDIKLFGKFASERAKLALDKNAQRTAGEKQCLWCKAKGDCPVLFEFTQQMLLADFENLEGESLQEDILTDKQKRKILDNTSLIKKFLDSVRESVYSRLMSGDTFEGYKLIEGRPTRKWAEGVEIDLLSLLGEEAYNSKLIGLTEAKKKIGSEKVSELTVISLGSPRMVPSEDRRQALSSNEDMFENLEENH